MFTDLSQGPSIVSQYLRELRDVELQKDRQRFAHDLERLGMIIGYEFSKRLTYEDHLTTTPLGALDTPVLKDRVVIGTVLRAGLPVQQGVSKVLDGAELAFVAAGRKPDTSKGVKIDLAYVASPSLAGKTLIMADTMLATGSSLVDACGALIARYGRPSRLFIGAIIASRTGVNYVTKHLPEAELIVCAVDPELNDDYFIVPGLGDAGDLLYGPKQ